MNLYVSDSDCDHVMSNIAGTFQSAGLNGNDNYGSNVLCMWMIQRFTPEHFLQVLVVEMDIQPSENCEADYLMVTIPSVCSVSWFVYLSVSLSLFLSFSLKMSHQCLSLNLSLSHETLSLLILSLHPVTESS